MPYIARATRIAMLVPDHIKLIFLLFLRAENIKYPVDTRPKSEKINPVASPDAIDPNPRSKIKNIGTTIKLVKTTRIKK